MIEKVKNRISGPCLKDSYILSEENQEEIPRNRSLLRSSWYNQHHFLLELCSFLLVMFAAFPRRDDIVNAARLPTAMKNVRKLIGMLGTRIAARGGWQGQSWRNVLTNKSLTAFLHIIWRESGGGDLLSLPVSSPPTGRGTVACYCACTVALRI